MGVGPLSLCWPSRVLTLRTPSFVGDTTFPNIAAESIRPPSRRPLPNIIQSLLPTGSLIPASFRPSATSTPVNPSSGNEWAPLPNAPAMKRPRGANGIKKPADQPHHGLPVRSNQRDLKSIEPNGEADAPVRRSSRLKAPPMVTAKVSSKVSQTTSRPHAFRLQTQPPRDRRGQRSQSTASSAASVDMTSPTSQDGQLQMQADDWLRDIVRRCARAHRSLSVYACAEAIREIDTLPTEVQGSAWALELAGRAYYEMASYTIVSVTSPRRSITDHQARRIYERLLEIEPYRLESLEHYSTLLWHLSDAPALSALSQSLMSISRESTQAWISTGNLFSLQRDHDEAMRCFKRATQIDPGCSYAWTLCGYEAIEMEEYDRAIAFYRTAIRTDARHYNAW
jgi:anaphase-promoting complex subunit 3